VIRCRGFVVLLLAAAVFTPALASAGEPVWGKDLVAGKDFPMPFGIGVTYFTQDQDYIVDKLEVGIPGFPPIPNSTLKIKNSIDELNGKLDAWLLPYLNVFGIAGHLDGTTDVDLSSVPGLAAVLPFTSLSIDYSGTVYGAGVVLAGGTDRFFGSLTGIATRTNLSGDFDSSVKANILTPRFGVHNYHGALYVGAMYLDAQEDHKGTVPIPFLGPVPFKVELSQKDDWNWVVGGGYSFTPNWVLELEAGFGGRDHVDAALTYRF